MDTNKQFDAALACCRCICLPSSATRCFLAHNASAGNHRPAFHQGKAHTHLRPPACRPWARAYFPEFIAIVNYGIIGVIQLRPRLCRHQGHIARRCPAALRRRVAAGGPRTHDPRKNRLRRGMAGACVSYVDLILTKIERTKEIEDHAGVTAGVGRHRRQLFRHCKLCSSASQKLTDEA